MSPVIFENESETRMRTEHNYKTREEANAFSDGVNLVGDIDVNSEPVVENLDGTFSVFVTVGDEGEDEVVSDE
jgi:hypothetical protein